MTAIDRLFRSAAFPRRPSGLFVPALRECARRQASRFPAIARLFARQGFSPSRLRTERDVELVPFLSVAAFKEFEFPPARPFGAALTLASSGTSGQRSRIVLDEGSLERVKRSAESVYGALGMVDKSRTANYLCMTYDPRKAKDLGTAFTDELLSSFTARAEVHYAIAWDAAARAFRFDLEATLAALRRMAATGLPLRVLGFPAHVAFTLEGWRARGWPALALGARSWVMTGGGWKGHAGLEIPKARFRAEAAAWLGLPVENVRDLYGLVEHGIPYVECRLGRMHVPEYARVFVRDPETLSALAYGRKGLLQLVTPYLTSYPSFSVLTTDWGLTRRHCRCGAAGETLELLGRAGRSPAKGCAVTAAELLKAAR
ncbi:MAG: hypothetical protein HY078_12015 [Elusimicrobia bacterium]|nr:hypothetical protein [Elusimicrobiota bacterium]